MPRQNENDSDIPHSELDMIEQAMNTMVQGTFSMLFNSLFGADQNTDLGRTFENNINMQQQPSSGMIGNDGSDFRRLANKSRQNRGVPTTSEEQDNIEESTAPTHQSGVLVIKDEPDFKNRHGSENMARIATPLPTMMNLLQFMLGNPDGQTSPSGSNETGTLLDLLLPSDQLFNSMDPETIPQSRQVIEGDSPQKGGINWSFSSTSQRRIVQADGTEETYITRTQNGITETIKKIKYPDGSMEETIETGGRNSNSNNSSNFLSRPATSAGHPTSSSSDLNHATPSGGPLGSIWRRLFG